MTLSGSLLRTLPDNPTAPPAPALRPWFQPEPRVWESSSENVDEKKGGERLRLCTEGLGSESSDDAEDIIFEMGDQKLEEREVEERHLGKELGAVGKGREYPPPISCIGRSGSVCFDRYKADGRVVLRETWFPTQEVLRASREGGRLRLSFVHMDDEDFEECERLESEDDRGDEDGKHWEKGDEEEPRLGEGGRERQTWIR